MEGSHQGHGILIFIQSSEHPLPQGELGAVLEAEARSATFQAGLASALCFLFVFSLLFLAWLPALHPQKTPILSTPPREHTEKLPKAENVLERRDTRTRAQPCFSR